MTDDHIYDPRFVATLFDEMSASYGITNYVSSFGFCERWRRQAIDAVPIQRGWLIVDLMSGMGECWSSIEAQLRGSGRIVGIDLSKEMCRRAERNRRRSSALRIDVVHGDALACALPDGVADCVVACFGLKTFSQPQIVGLAREVWRLLKPGGRFSFVEIAVPRSKVLRALYLFYLRHIIPTIGRLFLGNPENYRLLATYTEAFNSGSHVSEALIYQGLEVKSENLFFGCARRLTGGKATVELGAA